MDSGWITLGVGIGFLVVAAAFIGAGPIAKVKVAAGASLPEAKPVYSKGHFIRFLRGGFQTGFQVDRNPVPPLYRKALLWDLLFPLFYVPALTVLLVGTLGLALTKHDRFSYLIYLPLVAGIADWLENSSLLMATRKVTASATIPAEPWFSLSRAATALKWIATYASLILIAAGAVALGIAGAGSWYPPAALPRLIVLTIGISLYQPTQQFVLRRLCQLLPRRLPIVLIRRIRRLLPRLLSTVINLVAAFLVWQYLAPAFDVTRAELTDRRGALWFPHQHWLPVGGGLALAIIIALAIAYRIPAVRAHMADARFKDMTAFELVGTAVLIMIGTAAFEELVFRGFVLAAWNDAYRLPFAVAASSVLFGLWHIGPALDRIRRNTGGARADERSSSVLSTVLATTVFGVVFCGLRLVTGTIYAGIVVHATANIAGMVAAWFAARQKSGSLAEKWLS